MSPGERRLLLLANWLDSDKVPSTYDMRRWIDCAAHEAAKIPALIYAGFRCDWAGPYIERGDVLRNFFDLTEEEVHRSRIDMARRITFSSKCSISSLRNFFDLTEEEVHRVFYPTHYHGISVKDPKETARRIRAILDERLQRRLALDMELSYEI